jgi:hypothetical protein
MGRHSQLVVSSVPTAKHFDAVGHATPAKVSDWPLLKEAPSCTGSRHLELISLQAIDPATAVQLPMVVQAIEAGCALPTPGNAFNLDQTP